MLESEMDLSAGLYPDVKDWLKKKLIPNLNAWLAVKFPPVGGPPQPQTRTQQMDAMIQGIHIAVNPDGTLTAF